MDTGDIAAMNGFGAVYQGLNDYKSAFLYYKKSLGIDPNYQYALFNMGTAYEATLKYDSAIVYYEKAIRTDSNYTTAWGGLANVYKNLKDYGSSIRCYKKAIAITPDDTVLWVELGTIYRALNEFNNAIYCYKRAIQINPAYTFAWENIGYDYANILSYDSALKSYWIGINIPGSEKNWFGLAIYNVLKYSNAGSAVSWYDFAMAYKKYSLSKDSIVNYLHYSIQMDSSATHFDAWPELCEALKQQSFNENAIHYLEGKRSAGDQSFMLQYNLARCYYEANDYDKALDLLKSLYGNDPVEKIDRQDFLKIPEMKWEKLAK